MDLWIVVFIFVVIAIVAGILLWRFWPDVTRQSSGTGTSTPAGFLEPCSTVVTCGTGLTCEGDICKRDIGGTCNTVSGCVSTATACSNGVCIQGETGGLGQPPPCNSGLVPNSSNVCKGDTGFSCTTNSDCISLVCNGTCQEPKSLGEACLANQCNIGLQCSGGFCQSTGINTGESGAYCGTSGANPTCGSSLTCASNVCTTSESYFLEGCSSTTACFEPLICSGDICRFPVPNNSCSPNAQCMSGMTCQSGTCVSNSNLTCFENQHCSGGTCGQEALYLSTFKDPTWEYKIDIPPGVRFSRIETKGDEVWGLSTQEDTDLSGIYYLKNNNWIRGHDGQDDSGGLVDFSIGANGTVLTLTRIGTISKVKVATVNQDGTIALTPWKTSDGIQKFEGDDILLVFSIDVDDNSPDTIVSLQTGNIVLTGSESVDFAYLVTDASASGFTRLYNAQGTSTMDNVMYIRAGETRLSFTGPASQVTLPSTGSVEAVGIFSKSDSGFQDTVTWVIGKSPNVMYAALGGVGHEVPGYFGEGSLVAVTKRSTDYLNSGVYTVSRKCI